MSKSEKIEKNLKKLADRAPARKRELDEVERQAIARFRGLATTLESAIGMLRVGDHLGWRALAVIHSRRTLRKYEQILNINVKEYFPEIGPSAERSMGYLGSKKAKDFWKVVTGEEKVENKQELKD